MMPVSSEFADGAQVQICSWELAFGQTLKNGQFGRNGVFAVGNSWEPTTGNLSSYNHDTLRHHNEPYEPKKKTQKKVLEKKPIPNCKMGGKNANRVRGSQSTIIILVGFSEGREPTVPNCKGIWSYKTSLDGCISPVGRIS